MTSVIFGDAIPVKLDNISYQGVSDPILAVENITMPSARNTRGKKMQRNRSNATLRRFLSTIDNQNINPTKVQRCALLL
jgi:hypothetical protein